MCKCNINVCILVCILKKNKLKPSLSDVKASNEITIESMTDGILNRFCRLPELDNLWFAGDERDLDDAIELSFDANKLNKSFPSDLSYDDFDSIDDFLEFEKANANYIYVTNSIYTDRELVDYIATELKYYRRENIAVINDKDIEIAWRYEDGRMS